MTKQYAAIVLQRLKNYAEEYASDYDEKYTFKDVAREILETNLDVTSNFMKIGHEVLDVLRIDDKVPEKYIRKYIREFS